MDKERWQQIERLFFLAAELAEPERRRFLQAECAAEPELVDSVLALLASDNATLNITGLLQQEAAQLLQSADLTGTVIGQYKIVRALGLGGMGAVYLAERDDKQFTKQVAVKISHTRLANPVLLHAFKTERQILADLEHPAISRLLDGGTTEQGLPYLVMEYVKGEPVDRYCDARELSQTARLQLFVKVANAVTYAHQNMIVHCDIKPANILVTTDSEPKLLDFGIAHLLTKASQYGAENGSKRLTVSYASPEQQLGRTPSALSDVYSLGVTLHELLSGQLPATNGAVSAALPEDLRCILSKALQSAPDKRYSSVAAFTDDVKRFLGRHPVLARQDSWWYRSCMLVRRNQVSSLLFATVLFAVISFSIAIWLQSLHVARERDQARLQRDKAQAVSQFVSDMLAAVDPFVAQGQAPTVQQLLDQTSMQLQQNTQHALVQQPEVEAAVRQVIGQTYFSLGQLSEAQRHLERARWLAEQNRFTDTALFLSIIRTLAGIYKDQYKTADVLTLAYQALDLTEQLYGINSRETLAALSDLASAYHTAGELTKAEAMWFRLYQQRLQLLGNDHPHIVQSLLHLGIINHWLGKYELAADYYQRCLQQARKLLGEHHPDTLQCMSTLGSVYESSGRYNEAEPVIIRHIELATKVLGPSHPDTLRSQHNLADTYRGQQRYAEAEMLFRQVLQQRAEVLGQDNIETLQTRMKLGRVLLLQHQHAEAETLLSNAYQQMKLQLGQSHPSVLTAAQLLADTYLAQQKHPAALTLYQHILSIRQDKSAEHPDTIDALAGIARVYLQMAEPTQAAHYLEQAWAIAERFPDSQSVNLRLAVTALQQQDAP